MDDTDMNNLEDTSYHLDGDNHQDDLEQEHVVDSSEVHDSDAQLEEDVEEDLQEQDATPEVASEDFSVVEKPDSTESDNLNLEAKTPDDHLDTTPTTPNEDNLKNKLQKKASVVFERKDSDGSSFWSHSARNSVTSMFEGPSELASEAGPGLESSEQESPRRMLQKKRSSLAHKPDISMLERKVSQEPGEVHEFQKVMSGLKRVESKKCSEETMETSLSETDDKKRLVVGEEQGKDKKCDSNTDRSIKNDKNTKENKVNKKGEKKPVVSKTRSKTQLSETKSSNKSSTAAPTLARTSSLRAKDGVSKNTNTPKNVAKSLNKSASSSNMEQRKNKPDKATTAPASNKNPTRSRTCSPEGANAASKEDASNVGAARVTNTRARQPVNRTMSLVSKQSQAKTSTVQNKQTELRRTASMKKQEKVATTATAVATNKPGTKTENKNNVKDNLDKDNSVTFRSRNKKTPPPVPPKPRAGNKIDLKDLASSTQSTNKKEKGATQEKKRQQVDSGSKSTSIKPVMKKMAAKTSIAEMAKFAADAAVPGPVGQVSPSNNQFISHARATLSPAPSRKQRNIQTVESDDEEDEVKEGGNEIDEGGIVSESVSASSVILMFGGTGKFKKTPSLTTSSSNKDLLSEVKKDTEQKEDTSEKVFKSSRKLSSNKTSQSQNKKKSVTNTSKQTNDTAVDKADKKPLMKKKSSIGKQSKEEASQSSPRKVSAKRRPSKKTDNEGDSKPGSVIKTSMTVRLKNIQTEGEVKDDKEDPAPTDKLGDTLNNSISNKQFEIQMSPSKSRQ